MNILKTFACPTPLDDTFLVYWTNSTIEPRGVLEIRLAHSIDDRHIAAELYALQYLLEQKCVIGRDLIGNSSIKLVVSRGAIRKLHLRQSDKVHLVPYANFLTTRFAGCEINVNSDQEWFKGFSPESTEELVVNGPRLETINISGIGEVSVTQHVLERFATRFLPDVAPDKVAQTAWKKLIGLTSGTELCEVARNSLWANLNHADKSVRYFLNAKYKLILVVTQHPRAGMRLVTAYPATRHFHDLPKAA